MTEYRLEELFDLQMGKTPSRNNPEYWTSEDHKWISIGDLSKCGKYISETKEYLSDKAVEESGISLIPEKTVVMSFKLSIGKTAITAEPMYSNEAIMSFRDRHLVELLPDYVYYLLSGRDWDEGTNKAVMGKTMNKATLSKIKVKIHGIEQQRDIVSVLDNVSSIITARQQQLFSLDDLIKARFVEMFGDMVLNPNGWDRFQLGEVCDVRDGTHDSPQYYSEGYPLVTSKNVTGGKIDLTDCSLICEDDYQKINQRSKVDYGDILMPMIGTVGKPVIVNLEPVFAIKNVALIKFKKESKVRNTFVKALLESDYFDNAVLNKVRGGTQKFISLGDIRKLEICLPPTEIQMSFEDFIVQVDKSKVVVQKALNEAQLLFDSLMQQYFG